jgi:hypothetical protein
MASCATLGAWRRVLTIPGLPDCPQHPDRCRPGRRLSRRSFDRGQLLAHQLEDVGALLVAQAPGIELDRAVDDPLRGVKLHPHATVDASPDRRQSLPIDSADPARIRFAVNALARQPVTC